MALIGVSLAAERIWSLTERGSRATSGARHLDDRVDQAPCLTLVTKPVFVGLEAASSESGDAWAGFLSGLTERGLRCPLLVISDGASGLIGAVETTLSAALRQRCLIHRARNILAKVPKNGQAEVKADYWAIFDLGDDVEPGLDAAQLAQKNIDAFAKRWRDSYPAAVRALLADRESLTVYLRFPREHWNRIRHSNFIWVNRPRRGRLAEAA